MVCMHASCILYPQVEAIRISSLRALNDAESLLAGEDSWERLRENCVKAARIPVHEKLSRVFRCKASMNGTLFPRVRVLILQNYVVLDPAFYGPVVSKKVLVLRLFHMRDVRFAQVCILLCFLLLSRKTGHFNAAFVLCVRLSALAKAWRACFVN